MGVMAPPSIWLAGQRAQGYSLSTDSSHRPDWVIIIIIIKIHDTKYALVALLLVFFAVCSSVRLNSLVDTKMDLFWMKCRRGQNFPHIIMCMPPQHLICSYAYTMFKLMTPACTQVIVLTLIRKAKISWLRWESNPWPSRLRCNCSTSWATKPGPLVGS